MQYTDTFQDFRQELAQRLKAARQMGVPKNAVVSSAATFGDWLSENVDPRSPEQRLLQEMWKHANESEQKAIAGTLIRMIDER